MKSDPAGFQAALSAPWVAARGKLARIFERSIVLDPFTPQAPSSARERVARRSEWIDRVKSDLLLAPSPLEAGSLLARAGIELREGFSSDLNDSEGRFAHSARAALGAISRLALDPSPWRPTGEIDLPADPAALSLGQRAGARLAAFSKLAQTRARRLKSGGLKELAEAVNFDAAWNTLNGLSQSVILGAARIGLGLPLFDAMAAASRLGGHYATEAQAGAESFETRTPEERLALAKGALCERFGYRGLEIENDRALDAEAQLRLITAMSRRLAETAAKLGVDERSMGFEGEWTLRIIDAPVSSNAFGTSAFIYTDARVLGAPVSSDAVSHIEHEWTHVLDFQLFHRAKEAAQKAGAGAAPFWSGGRPFFSLLPPEGQDFLPLAKEGYLRVAGAGQNVDGAAGFEAIAKQSLEESILVGERIVAQMLSRLSDLPCGGLESLGEAESEALRDSVSGAIKYLANGPEAQHHAVRLASPQYRSAPRLSEDLRFSPEGGSTRVALQIVADAFTRQWGSSWREELPAAPSIEAAGPPPSSLGKEQGHLASGLRDPIEQVARSFAFAVERNAEALARVGWSKGSGMHALNPNNEFAKASKSFSVGGIAPAGYWDSAHEMLARSVGRPSSLRQRLVGFGQAHPHDSPQMGLRQQGWLAQGWAQMTQAAGLPPAQRSLTARDAMEALYVGVAQAPRLVAAAASATENAFEALASSPQKALGAARAKLGAFRRDKNAGLAGGAPIAPAASAEEPSPRTSSDPTDTTASPSPSGLIKNLASRRALTSLQPSPAPGPSPRA